MAASALATLCTPGSDSLTASSPRGVIAVNRMPLAPSGRTSRAVIAAGVTSPKSSTVAAVARARQACAQGWSALITA